MEIQSFWIFLATLIALTASAWLFLRRGVPVKIPRDNPSRKDQSRGRTYRIRGVPTAYSIEELEVQLIKILQQSDSDRNVFTVKSLASAASSNSLVATVDFDSVPSLLQTITGNQWTHDVKDATGNAFSRAVQELTFDTHFRGLTPLYTASTIDEAAIRTDIIAVSGLGSHAFGSFKEREGPYMWLRDGAVDRLPQSNMWIYGFDSTVYMSKSVQTIDDLATGLVSSIREIMFSNPQAGQSSRRQLILIGHSLGGLVIKQAIIRLSKSKSDLGILKNIRGMLFFGVPNQGMAYKSLLAMSDGGPNEYLLHTLGPISEVLPTQREHFTQCVAPMNCRIYCFYETMMSPTAMQDDQGRWRMNGPDELLVTRESATSCFAGGVLTVETQAVNTTHSELVKFRRHDQTAESIFNLLANLSLGESLEEKSSIHSKHENKSENLQYHHGLQISQAPHLEQSLFKGRTKELEFLAESLLPESKRQKVIAISGLGGIGKTQLALMFTRQYQSYFSSIIWLNCKTEGSFRSDIVTFMSEVLLLHDDNIGALNSTDDSGKITKFRSWLSEPENNQWLIILDNYDTPLIGSSNNNAEAYSVKKYFPYKQQGSILITTRSTKLPYRAMPQLQKLSDEEAKDVLLQRSGRQPKNEELVSLERLLSRLGGLPLAIATAGDYLRQAPITFTQYLDIYDLSWQALSNAQLSDYEDRTLFSTWNLSLRMISPKAARLLQFLAYFDNHDIWYNLLRKANEYSPDVDLSDVLDEEIHFIENMRILQDFSLVEVLQDSNSYCLHTCVHDWTLHQLNLEVDPALLRLAFKCILKSYNWEQLPAFWSKNKRLALHSLRLSCSAFKALLDRDASWIGGYDLHMLGRLYHEQGQYGEAEQMCLRALQCDEAQYANSTSRLRTLNNLGLIYRDQDKHEKSEQTFTQALLGYEKTIGPDHIRTLTTVYNLGRLYQNLDRIDETEQMLLRALRGYEAIHLEDSPRPNTFRVDTLIHLGILYRNQGRLEEAERAYARALKCCDQALDSIDKPTLSLFHNLGLLYQDQGKLEDAEQMLERALKGYEKAIGPDHQYSLNVVCSLGVLYRTQGKLDQAEQMIYRAVAGAENPIRSGRDFTERSVTELFNTYRRHAYSYPSLAASRTVPRILLLLFTHKSSSFNGLSSLGRVLLIAKDDDGARQCYHQLYRATGSLWTHADCDGCEAVPDDQSQRFICKDCFDVDLCKKCHSQCVSDASISAQCHGQEFLELSCEGFAPSSEDEVEELGQQLIRELAERYCSPLDT